MTPSCHLVTILLVLLETREVVRGGLAVGEFHQVILHGDDVALVETLAYSNLIDEELLESFILK